MFIQEIRVDPIKKKCYYYIKTVPDFRGDTGVEKSVSLVWIEPSPPVLKSASYSVFYYGCKIGKIGAIPRGDTIEQ